MIQTAPAVLVVALCLVFGLAAFAGEPGEAVRRYRTGMLTIRAKPGTRVTVRQLRHEFWFGTAVNAGMWTGRAKAEDRERYLEVLRENFNAAVHENALKWYSTEKRRGEVSYESAEAALAWCEKEGIPMRGHCVFWGIPKFVQPWIKELDDGALRAALEARAKDVMTRFRGRIREYDVNNEMIHGDYYAERLGAEIEPQMFLWCRAADPEAVLYVNDYGILTGGDLAKYEAHIRALLKAGAPVGGIGLQGHFGKPADPEKVQKVLDRLAAFELPIRITEYDCNAADEADRARSLRNLYRTAFAHPAVTGILMWGFWEGRHWRPQAAPWRRDWTPTAVAEAYRELVFGEWWTEAEAVAGGDGVCRVRAFFGRHRVSAGGLEKTVELRKADGELTVELTP
jgi:GH35 family endo-1,4-beta-xylanase